MIPELMVKQKKIPCKLDNNLPQTPARCYTSMRNSSYNQKRSTSRLAQRKVHGGFGLWRLPKNAPHMSLQEKTITLDFLFKGLHIEGDSINKIVSNTICIQ